MFDDPYEAVRDEIASIQSLAFVPSDLIVHGLVYTLATGEVDVVVDGTT